MCNIAGHSTVILFSIIRDFNVCASTDVMQID